MYSLYEPTAGSHQDTVLFLLSISSFSLICSLCARCQLLGIQQGIVQTEIPAYIGFIFLQKRQITDKQIYIVSYDGKYREEKSRKRSIRFCHQSGQKVNFLNVAGKNLPEKLTFELTLRKGKRELFGYQIGVWKYSRQHVQRPRGQEYLACFQNKNISEAGAQ